MGFLSGLFGGGGSSSVATSKNEVSVEVNPVVNVVNAVDLGPVQALVDNLARTQTRLAALSAVEANAAASRDLAQQGTTRALVENLKSSTTLAVVGIGAALWWAQSRSAS